jgi:hypothetical protein
VFSAEDPGYADIGHNLSAKFQNHLLTICPAYRASAAYTSDEVQDELKKLASEKCVVRFTNSNSYTCGACDAVCMAPRTKTSIPCCWSHSASSIVHLHRQAALTSGRATKSQRKHATLLLMRALAGKNVAFNFATSTSFLQYVPYISRHQFSAPSRWDLFRVLKELCGVIAMKLAQGASSSSCADAWTSAGCHVTAVTAGNRPYDLPEQLREFVVSGAEATAACIVTSPGFKEGCDADSDAYPSKAAVLTSDTTAMMPAMARQLHVMPLCKGLVWALCFPHLTNLLLQDQLQVPDIAQLVAHATQIVLKFRSCGSWNLFIFYDWYYCCLMFCIAKSDHAVHAFSIANT